MDITFKPLAESDFSHLLKWLQEPHVKAWWDQDIQWTPELIREKFGDYVNGYKTENGARKKVNAYIIHVGEIPIGYIQAYNAHDFSRTKPLTGLPEKLAAFDIFIGEPDYVHQGIGSRALRQFLDTLYDEGYAYAFADPATANTAAIKAYGKAGFKIVQEHPDIGETWMVRALEPPARETVSVKSFLNG